MPRRGRPKKGDRRIDAAIDHFAAMGFPARDVRKAIAQLLEAYGGPDAWPFLEEGCYYVVQEKLIEKQEQEKLLLPEHNHQDEEEEPPQHLEPAVNEAPPENNLSILEVHNEVPAESESPDEEVEDPIFTEPPALDAVVPLPLPAATGTGGTRRPCHGWLSESEDEEEITGQQHVHVLSLGGGLLRKRKWPE
ncbi:uncharacterized protein LOC133902141 [Phragmites australis]|uniref:uncharacterized protein LOC133902141 n=1 Tax=Phragmites australis TaxID=29695 RepID=UPI002D76EA14|nr:uncharacterized protein LOC133902141 [Phragmites australis]XP_062199719.1 uncharacterized protein LOC133902141 [Phragmites australis]